MTHLPQGKQLLAKGFSNQTTDPLSRFLHSVAKEQVVVVVVVMFGGLMSQQHATCS